MHEIRHSQEEPSCHFAQRMWNVLGVRMPTYSCLFSSLGARRDGLHPYFIINPFQCFLIFFPQEFHFNHRVWKRYVKGPYTMAGKEMTTEYLMQDGRTENVINSASPNTSASPAPKAAMVRKEG